ncbi:efflux RND transporter periplasmic adaptor subunit [Thermodesulfatator autotrophicus]|uniref:Multidrug resistance protein MdtA-like barrel-sandwich hybrid domain-containing protein n=1 Tax=Thermodesulfatator autotrophicus TaxID=1795632 RepID=A0A177E8M4_9BACT|nr:efflux RND transporter periplasmic adaptor subunit [Thermodesulfatator autotrophicus]OAG28307.1 hypothetical protein TH606_02275 [Thermodesulfatator autotrophicus]
MPKKALFLLILTIFLANCEKREEPQQAKPFSQVKAKVFEVKAVPVSSYRIFPGKVCAKQKITIKAKVSGYVEDILVKEGEKVKAHQVLLRIDSRSIKARLKAIEAEIEATIKEYEAVLARLKYAEANLKRFKALWEEQASTKEELERALSEFKSLKAKSEALKARQMALQAEKTDILTLLDYAVIKAPSEAVVTQRLVGKGSVVNPGEPLLILDNLKAGFEFCAEIDESFFKRLRPGQILTLEFPSLGKTLNLPLTTIVSQIDPSSRTFHIKIDLPSDLWPSGLFGQVKIPEEETKKTLIPGEALIVRGDIYGVFTLSPSNTARFQVVRIGSGYIYQDGKWIKTALSRATHWEVLSGLEEGEKVVLSPEKVKDGAQVIF